MRISVDRLTYQAFYEAFKNDFIMKVFPKGNSPYGRGNDSPKIWEETNPLTGKFIVSEIVDHCVSENYFYKQSIDFKDRDKKNLSSQAIAKALEYMGFSLPKEFRVVSGSWNDRATELLHQFRAKHNISDGYSIKTISVKAEPERITACLDCIKQYHEAISKKNTEQAWNLLSRGHRRQRPWKNDFGTFHEWIHNHAGFIEDLSIFDITQVESNMIEHDAIEGDDIECTLFYHEILAPYWIESNPLLQSSDVKLVGYLPERIAEIREHIENRSKEKFDELLLSQLFTPMAGDYIIFECDMYGSKHFIRKQYVVRRARLIRCSCVITEKGWRIDYLNSITTFPHVYEKPDRI